MPFSDILDLAEPTYCQKKRTRTTTTKPNKQSKEKPPTKTPQTPQNKTTQAKMIR